MKTMRQWNWFVGLLMMAMLACTPLVQKRFVPAEEIKQLPREAVGERNNPCYSYLTYAPDTAHLDHTPVKYIRVNFHFMNSADSLCNLPQPAARAWALEYLRAGNHALANNEKAIQPRDNELPVLPTRYQYVLTSQPGVATDDGIYFHYDDECYFIVNKGGNSNIYDDLGFDRYRVQKDTVLNIFMLPHHPDSVRSKTYGAYGTGVALGQYIKIGWNFAHDAQLNPWEIRGTLNHEIGHIYSLVHAWAYNDGCDDTPQHSMDTVSNNLMNYNSSQMSYTPCQIGKIHNRMASLESQGRKFLVPNWCALHDDQHVYIRDSVHWQSQKDLEGHLTIRPGGFLRISCRVSLPKGAKIAVEPGGTLVLDDCKLHNACGDQWEGIEVQELKEEVGVVYFLGNPKIENLANPILPSGKKPKKKS
jgi:hypothetical protein